MKFFFNGILTDVQSARAAIKDDPLALARLSNELKQDESLLLFALELYGNDYQYKGEALLTYFDPKFRDNKAIMLTAIKRHPMAVMYASERLKDDDDIACAATERGFGRGMHLEDAVPLEYLSLRLRENEKIARASLNNFPDALRFFSDEFQIAHPELVLSVIMQSPYLLKMMCSEIQKKYSDILIPMVEKELHLVTGLCHDLQNQHPSLILKAIHDCPYFLVNINEDFQETHQQDVLDIVKLEPKVAAYVTRRISKEKIHNAVLEGFHSQYIATTNEILKLKQNPDFKNHCDIIDNLVHSLLKLEGGFLQQFNYAALITLKKDCEKLFGDVEKKFDDGVLVSACKAIANTFISLLNFMINIFTIGQGRSISLYPSTLKVWKNNELKVSLLDKLHLVEQCLKADESPGNRPQRFS